MSRVGKQPIDLPEGVDIDIKGNSVTVKGKLGELSLELHKKVKIELDDNKVVIRPKDQTKSARSKHGLYRNLVFNMVKGVSEGFSRTLKIIGVGFRATKKGNDLELLVGYSNPVIVKNIEGIEFEVPDNTTIIVKGKDKQLVGEMASKIRDIRRPEPYKGKGIKYAGEQVRRKVGKAAVTATAT